MVVLRSPERPLTDAEQRAKVFGLREWCAANPGVKANLLSLEHRGTSGGA